MPTATQISIEEHVANLQAALSDLDVLIGCTKAPVARYGESNGSSDIEETENEKHARYLIYWHEFNRHLSPTYLACIRLGYCRRKPWPMVARMANVDNPELHAADGLRLIACRIEALLR